MSYEYFYPGTPYSLEPNYGDLFTGYRVPFKELGAATSIQTANQIQEVTNLLNQGGKTVELQPVTPEVFDTIPKQHFKEINRLTKLTGAETTVHAPMIDPSGFTREGWSEAEREQAERQLMSVVERSHELSPDGNMPVTIHASAIPGTEYSKPSKELIENYKNQVQKRYGRAPTPEQLRNLEESQIIAINQETGQLVPIKREEKYYPEIGKIIRIPEEEIDTVNNTEWINGITNLAFYKKQANDVLTPAYSEVAGILVKGMPNQQEYQEHKGAFDNLQRADLFLDNVITSFRAIYSKAYKYGDANIREKLDDVAKLWQDKTKLMSEARTKNPMEIPIIKSNLIDETLNKLRGIEHPGIYKKVEDFAVEKSADTLSAAAFNAYEKYKDKAPIISIENLYPGMAFSRSEELKKLVEATRDKFVERAKKEGISTSEAENAAKRLIGVTWDVGHLNMLRKSGFNEEEIKEETEKIAKLVKHVHLTDNFGFTDSHLPPGMGNVPIKDILKELEAAGFKGKKIEEDLSSISKFHLHHIY